METRHGAQCASRKPNKLGVMPGSKASGTVNAIDTMGTGRKVSFGSTVMTNQEGIKTSPAGSVNKGGSIGNGPVKKSAKTGMKKYK